MTRTFCAFSAIDALQTAYRLAAGHALRFTIAGVFTFTSSAAIAALPTIERLRAGNHEEYVRLVIEMSETSTPDIVRHVDGFAIFFDGVDAPGETLLASAGPLVARVERSMATLTAVYVEGVTGAQPKRYFTLPARQGDGIRMVLDFEPRPYGDFVEPSSVAAQLGGNGRRVPRMRKIEWSVSQRRSDRGAKRDMLAELGEDVMAGAPQAPLRREKRPPPPVRAILPDFKGRERKLNQVAFYGYVEAEGRPYLQESIDGDRPRVTGSIAAQPTLEWQVTEGHAFKITGFGRVDAADSRRTHAEVREAKYTGQFGNVQFTAGFDTLFWGTTESFHLVDIINQIDGVEDIDDEDKRGELMVAGSLVTKLGTFSAYAMPLARQRTFPGADGRPNGPLLVDMDQALYDGSDDPWHFSFAGRYFGSFDMVDLGLSYFNGIARDPRLTLGFDDDNPAQAVLIPNYDQIEQVGIDAQITAGPLLLKGEAIHQWSDFGDYTAFIAGFEYTLFNSIGGADIGLLSEFLYDDRGEGAPLPFEEDVFVGVRAGFNDTRNTEVLAGAIIDLDGDGTFINVEASTRLGEKWRISLDARILTQSNQPSAFQAFQDDDFVQLRVQRYF
ncbi:MAG: hypothetical protein AAF337_06535 [Pseudomonadota bacterium]